MANLKVNFVLHGCIPGEKLVGDYLFDPIRRSEKIRGLLISGLDKMPKADVFDANCLDTKETLCYSVLLNESSENDLKFITAYRKIPVSCQKYWLVQRLVAAVNPVSVTEQKVPPVELLKMKTRTLDINLCDPLANVQEDDLPF